MTGTGSTTADRCAPGSTAILPPLELRLYIYCIGTHSCTPHADDTPDYQLELRTVIYTFGLYFWLHGLLLGSVCKLTCTLNSRIDFVALRLRVQRTTPATVLCNSLATSRLKDILSRIRLCSLIALAFGPHTTTALLTSPPSTSLNQRPQRHCHHRCMMMQLRAIMSHGTWRRRSIPTTPLLQCLRRLRRTDL